MIIFGTYLKSLRGKRSRREIERLSGVSHTHLGTIESGIDPRSGNKILPSSESLRKLAVVYKVSFIDLMILSGHMSHEEVSLWSQQNSEHT